MPIGPVPARPSTAESCARVLRDAILRGELHAGQRLPAERVLARHLGVGRVTLRSALARLESANLVTVRQGSGYLITDYRRQGGPELIAALAGLARRRGALAGIAADLLLVRRQLARAVLEKVNRKELGPAREALRRMAAAVEAGASVEEIARADLGVVAALLDATHSPVLQLCLNPVAALLANLPALRDALYRDPAANVLAWELALTLVARRQPGAADAILEELRRRDEAAVREL